jgi:hypothetical protein
MDMDKDDALQMVAHFFNDIIGALVPGLVLGTGLFFTHRPLLIANFAPALSASTSGIALMVALAFAAGHGLLAVHSAALGPLFNRICKERDPLAKAQGHQ